MNPYAVIESGGKQHIVRAGEQITVERLPSDDGAALELKPVLAFSDGNSLAVGRPHLANASVAATVVRHMRGPKLISFKQKRRKGYHRKKGHRQELTVLLINELKCV